MLFWEHNQCCFFLLLLLQYNVDAGTRMGDFHKFNQSNAIEMKYSYFLRSF